MITYGKWHSIAVRWGSINSYSEPLTFYTNFYVHSLTLTFRCLQMMITKNFPSSSLLSRNRKLGTIMTFYLQDHQLILVLQGGQRLPECPLFHQIQAVLVFHDHQSYLLVHMDQAVHLYHVCPAIITSVLAYCRQVKCVKIRLNKYTSNKTDALVMNSNLLLRQFFCSVTPFSFLIFLFCTLLLHVAYMYTKLWHFWI